MPTDQENAPEAPQSVRAGLEAAFAADAAAQPAEIKPASIPDPATAAPVTPAPTQTAAERARDEAGRFAAKAETTDKPGETPAAPIAAKPDATTETTDKPATAETEAPKEPIPPPAALSAAAKAKWSTLPTDLQSEWAKRETDMVQGMQKQALLIKRFERMDEAIAPHRNYLAMNGLDEATYVRSLIAADETLRGPNPLHALAQIGQMYGIDLRQIAQGGQQPQGQQPQGQQPQAQPDHPALQALTQQLAQVQGRLAQYETSTQEAQASQMQAHIDAFARDNVYYENVRPLMAALLRTPALQTVAETNPAQALKDAYDQACRASPEVWPLLQEEQTRKQQAAERAEATQRATEARQAAASVTGSPAPGSTPAAPPPATSLRESLERGFSAYA